MQYPKFSFWHSVKIYQTCKEVGKYESYKQKKSKELKLTQK